MTLLLLAPLALAAARDVSLKSSDGVSLHARAEAEAGVRRGVVLVHSDGRDSGDWAYLSERLSRSGMAVIAPDLRGHGASGGPARGALTDGDYAAMALDVQAAVGWLRQQGVEQISCVGAELGANLCLQAGAQDPQLASVVLLSPQLSSHGVKSPSAMQAYGARPAFVVASTEDTAATRCAEILDRVSGGQIRYKILESAGSGTRMLSRDPGLELDVTDWLAQLGAGGGPAVDGFRPTTEENTTIQTTGRKLHEHQ